MTRNDIPRKRMLQVMNWLFCYSKVANGHVVSAYSPSSKNLEMIVVGELMSAVIFQTSVYCIVRASADSSSKVWKAKEAILPKKSILASPISDIQCILKILEGEVS